MIFYILGMASGFEALFLLLPILVSLIYGESVLSSYLISCGICALFCGVSTLRKPKKITLYTKYRKPDPYKCNCYQTFFGIQSNLFRLAKCADPAE